MTLPEKLVNDCAKLISEGRANEQILATLRRVDAEHPNHFGILFNMARACQDLGHDDEALKLYHRVIKLAPKDSPCYRQSFANMGIIYDYRNDYKRAIRQYRHALDVNDMDPCMWTGIGIDHQQMHQFAESLGAFRKALDVDPKYFAAYFNIADVFFHAGKIGDAIAWSRRGLKVQKYAAGHSNLLFHVHHYHQFTNEQVLAEHVQWAQMHSDPVPKCTGGPYKHDKIRIGYVSGDFKRHAVGGNFLPVFRHHDKSRFDTYCYSMVPVPHKDVYTREIEGLATGWREVLTMKDAEIVDQIRKDEIDILVDLTGHTALHRTMVFAAKPAPVQCTWIGWVGTTGIKEIDYRLSDEMVEPAGCERYYVEKLLKVPNSCCYTPVAEAPPVVDPPCLKNGYVTFGSFNTLSKLNPDVVELWARILQTVPNSRLVLKARWLKDKVLRQDFMKQFTDAGADPTKIRLLCWDDFAKSSHYLEAAGLVDIALDPFPFNGGITTFESLWAGVPVISLIGDRFVARMGVRILSLAGLHECLAHSKEHYVQIASTLASAPDHLRGLRHSMRVRVMGSPLVDGKGICREIEGAFERVRI